MLSLKHPAIIAEDPNSANKMYSITEKKEVNEIAADIANKFLCLNSPLDFPKTIVFCQKLVKL